MSKFSKGFGIGAAIVAAAGVAGAGYLAVKKIKESDKRVDELIKDALRRKSSCGCKCEKNTVEEVVLPDDEIINVLDTELAEAALETVKEEAELVDEAQLTIEDYLESVIQERDALRAENDELKSSKRKRNKQ